MTSGPLTPAAPAAYALFGGARLKSVGTLAEIALAAWRATTPEGGATLIAFADATGEVVDLDISGDEPAVRARYAAAEAAGADEARRRGRPRLGVEPREVTLLPRHWAWLAAQPGGASAALRRLVDDARRIDAGATRARAAQTAAYRFLQAIAGDWPGFEEASRALFAGDRDAVLARAAAWPKDVADYALRLGFPQS